MRSIRLLLSTVLLLTSSLALGCGGPGASGPMQAQQESLAGIFEQLSNGGYQYDDDWVTIAAAKRELLQEHWFQLTPTQRQLFAYRQFDSVDDAEDTIEDWADVNEMQQALAAGDDFITYASVLGMLRNNIPGVALVEEAAAIPLDLLRQLGVPLPGGQEAQAPTP